MTDHTPGQGPGGEPLPVAGVPPLEPPLPPNRPFDPAAIDASRPFGADAEEDFDDDAPSAAAPRRRTGVAGLALMTVLIVLAFGVGIAVGRASAPSAPAAAPSGSAVAGSPGASSLASLPSEGTRLGRADARVVLIYWADYQCPYCAKFAQTILPELASRIADGTLAVEHRDFAFIGEESIDAAIAVRCAGRSGHFWAMHDAVYAAQQGENQGAFTRARLQQVAASVGLDATAFGSCLDEQPVLVDVLDDTAAGLRSGVASTPTIDVNGTRFLGVSDVAALLKVVDAAAAGATPAPLVTPAPSKNAWSDTTTAGREAGPATAPVTVELWLDYQSTDSAAIASTLEPELRTRIADGKVHAVLRDLAMLGSESVFAATAVRCVAAVDPRAWLTSDVLAVAAQGPGAGIFTEGSILRFVSRMGMDVRSIAACLGDARIIAAVKAETAIGASRGLSAAPAVIVLHGTTEVARFTGALDLAKVLAAVDAAP